MPGYGDADEARDYADCLEKEQVLLVAPRKARSPKHQSKLAAVMT